MVIHDYIINPSSFRMLKRKKVDRRKLVISPVVRRKSREELCPLIL